AVRIRVNDIPSVSIVRDVEKGCAPVEVVFNTPNTNIGQGRWTLGDGSEPLNGLTVSHTYTAAGTYSVVFSYWDEIGCSTQTILQNAVTVFEVPRAYFSYEPYDEVTIAHPDVQFINQSQVLGNNTYQWQIADMYSLPDVNPMVIFPKAGDYRVTLTATTKDGCVNEASAIITVKPDFNVFIPNSFTPNLDGINDVFLPVFSAFGLDPKTFDMEIFTRWGTSIYHTKDNTKGWDGSIQNKGAEPLKEEVYVYKLKYKDLEGKIYNKLGYVTLLR
ncbi:MAG TPA: PKD domain-containing protein, partial [Bacteroidia bacterium]|nr:PKD domain-containing protein [Bacteroidia bacterium]